MKIINQYAINIYAFLLMIVMCLTCCQNNNKTKNEKVRTFEKFQQEESLSFTNLFEFKKGIPCKILSLDSTLVICDALGLENGAYFYNYSLPNKRLSKGYFKAGRGSGEALTAFSTGIIGDVIWSYDITMQRITTIDKEKALKQEKNIDVKQYPEKVLAYQIAFKDTNTIFAVGDLQSKYKIQEIDLKSQKIIAQFGEFNDVPHDIPFKSYKNANECFILTKPSGEKAVISYRYKDEIEIFDTKNHKSIIIKGPEGFEPDLDFTPNAAFRNKNTRFAFFNGVATDKFIYLLYSGNGHQSEFHEYCNTVYVYEWSGNPIRKIKLNKYVTSLSVNKDDSVIYAYDPSSTQIVQAQIRF